MTAFVSEDQPLPGQKRQRGATELEHSTIATPHPPWKKVKRRHQSQQETDAAYWDSLSKLWLTRRALDELDRRNRRKASPVERNGDKPRQLRSLSKQLKSFAKDGGPDLYDLRGVSLVRKVEIAADLGSPVSRTGHSELQCPRYAVESVQLQDPIKV